MTDCIRFLTVGEKQKEIAEWEALCRARPSAIGDVGGRGFPDPDMIPWCAALNAIPGVCTVQSCAGHGTQASVQDSAHLWLRFDGAMSTAFDAEAYTLAADERIEQVSRVYSSCGKEIASITFAGNERDSLNESMTLTRASAGCDAAPPKLRSRAI